jgi:hypothetical protein
MYNSWITYSYEISAITIGVCDSALRNGNERLIIANVLTSHGQTQIFMLILLSK